MNLNAGQDWNEVVLTRRPPGGAGASDSKNVRAAMQKGEAVDTLKKRATQAPRMISACDCDARRALTSLSCRRNGRQ